MLFIFQDNIFNSASGTETEDDECLTHGDHCPTRRSSTPDETDNVIKPGGSRGNSRRRSLQNNMNMRRRRSSVKDTLNNWAPYVAAGTAVGLGFLYTYAKH